MNDGTQKLGELRDSKGEPVLQMFGAANALTEGADTLSQSLYCLSETVIRGLFPDERRGGMGGEFGYACDYENDVFMMHHYCWCEEDKCQWCSGSAPNFLHKPTGFSLVWYKWIGRDMRPSRAINGADWKDIFESCWNSIPEEARTKAEAEHKFDNSPEQLELGRKYMARLWEVMSNPKKHGCKPKTRVCDSCGKEYEYVSWATTIMGSCGECMKARFGKR